MEKCDFPSVLGTLDYWIQQRISRDSNLAEDSAEIEADEINQFENTLRYLISNPGNDKVFRDQVKIIRLGRDTVDGDAAQFTWLKQIWGLGN